MRSGITKAMYAVGIAMTLAACSSGGDGGGGGTPTAALPSTGVFIDSPVQGLGYMTSTGLSGTTDANGQFNYNSGDTLTFSLYGRQICSNVPAAPVVTALSCFGATSLTDPRVLNLSQLLLTLGGVPVGLNPIVLPPTPPAGFPATIDFSAPGFDTSFPGLMLVSESTATTHLSTSFKTLAVTLVNGGTVTSNPSGINCTAGICTAVFQAGTVVTLTATGGNFTGGCSGTGTCMVTLNVDTTVTATFGVATEGSIYQFTWVQGGPLLAIDPANPTAPPITVASTVVWAEKAEVSATYDGKTQTANNVRWVSLIYASGGKLVKIKMEKSAGVPGSAANPPVQMSNETNANVVCDINPILSAGPGFVEYQLPGSDGDCGTRTDNVSKLAPLSATEADPPTVFAPGLLHSADTVFNFTTGTASHALFTEEATATLKVLDLTNIGPGPTLVQANVGTKSEIELVAQHTSDRVFLIGRQTLYLYTISTKQLTVLKTGSSPMYCFGSSCVDSTHVYVAEEAGKVYRVPLIATGPADVQTVLDGTTPIQQVELTTNRVLVVTQNSPTTTDNALLSIAKTGGVPTTVVPAASENVIPFVFTKNNLAFYSLLQSGSSDARIIQEDGTPLDSKPGEWITAGVETSVSLRSQAPAYTKLVLLNGGFTTGTMVSLYDAATPTTTPTVSLGAWPSTPHPVSFVIADIGFDSGQLLIGQPPSGVNTSVLFVDLDVPNSLVPVPTTANAWQTVF